MSYLGILQGIATHKVSFNN